MLVKLELWELLAHTSGIITMLAGDIPEWEYCRGDDLCFIWSCDQNLAGSHNHHVAGTI